MTRVPDTLEYEGIAYTEASEPVKLPYGTYEVHDIELADPSVGIRHGCAMILAPGYDDPLMVPEDEYDAFVQDCREGARMDEAGL